MKKSTIAVVATALFVLIGVAVYLQAGFIDSFDSAVRASIKPLRSPAMSDFFLFMTRLGDASTVAVAGILSALLLFFQKRMRAALAIIALPAVTFIIVEGVKSIVGRLRPTGGLIIEHGPSFPSGHATIAAVFFASLFFAFASYNPSRGKRVLTATLLILLVILIATSRVYLGVHFPSDVIAGLLLGFGIAICGEKYLL